MSEDEAVVEEVKSLILNHRGSNNPITSREINNEMGLDNIGSFPSTRAVIRELVKEHQVPIAGSSQGYYLINSEDELDEYVDNLESRVMQITERKFAVRQAVSEWYDDGLPGDAPEEDDDLL